MGPFSITGQPNAMGGREVGALSNTLAAHMDFALEDVGRVGRFWNTNRVPRKAGLKAVELFEAVRAGRVKAVWIMATNPVASLPNADAVRAALAACELSIVSEAIRASDTVDACRVRLPALAWAEKSGTVTNSERGISRQRAFLPPPGEARQDWWIIAEVARRLGHGEEFAWKGAADIFREHASLSAFENEGQRDFDIGAYADIDDSAYDSLKPFVWPARRGAPSKPRFFAEGGFFHSDGRARFIATAAREPIHGPSGDWPIRLNTGRVRDQWHTMTRTAKSPRLAGHRPEPTIELNAIDATQRGLQDGDIAEVTSAWGRAALRVHLSTALRQGEAFAPMHWTAQLSRAGRINAAVNPAVDPISGQPELKHTPVEIRRLAVQWHGTILARRPIMLPEVTYWARVTGAGHYAYLLAGEQPLAVARRALSAAIRTTNPGPWLDGEEGLGAVISDSRLEAVLGIGKAHDEAVRDRLAPFMAMAQLDAEQRRILLHGGDAADRGGEICACLGVSCAAVQTAIANGAMTLDAVGAVTKAGTSCGSCRPEIRTLLRAARPRQAA
jgi:assimilatory nitrate reductase catalytic subunit